MSTDFPYSSQFVYNPDRPDNWVEQANTITLGLNQYQSETSVLLFDLLMNRESIPKDQAVDDIHALRSRYESSEPSRETIREDVEDCLRSHRFNPVLGEGFDTIDRLENYDWQREIHIAAFDEMRRPDGTPDDPSTPRVFGQYEHSDDLKNDLGTLQYLTRPFYTLGRLLAFDAFLDGPRTIGEVTESVNAMCPNNSDVGSVLQDMQSEDILTCDDSSGVFGRATENDELLRQGENYPTVTQLYMAGVRGIETAKLSSSLR